MKKNYVNFARYVLGVSFGLLGFTIEAQTVQAFYSIGAMQTFTVPTCVNTLTVDLRGSQGSQEFDSNPSGGSLGGNGGRVQAVLSVTQGQVLYIFVGNQAGYNGGGTGGMYAANGGGATDVRIGGTALSNRVLVAGGGGGGGNNCYDGSEFGGTGGGTTGGSGYQCSSQTSYVGTGGSQTTGGVSLGSQGSAGSFGVGGNGYMYYGGGGGGGYYGGGGGSYGGGGGGSGYAGAGTSNVVQTNGYQTGNGIAYFTFGTMEPRVQIAASSAEICEGDNVTLTASNVQTYTWSTNSNLTSISVSPLVTTTYSITGTNNLGCISDKAITVTVNPLPNLATTTSPTLICVGSTATVSAFGAVTYSWVGNNVGQVITVSPPVTTNYTVSGTDSKGCVNTKTVDVLVNSNVLTVTSNTSVCIGSEVELMAQGGVEYMWSNQSPFYKTSVQPNTTTVYSVTATDMYKCPHTGYVQVTVNPKPNVTANASSGNVCINDQVVLTGGGASTYVWSNGGTTSSVAVTPTVDLPTSYTVTGTSTEGCKNTAVVTVNVERCVGINEASLGAFSAVYPNPFSSSFQVKVTSVLSGAQLEVFNSAGKLIRTVPVNTGETTIDMSEAASGIYLIRLSANGKTEGLSKIIKQ